MDLKIDFMANDNGQAGKDLYASIKYKDEIENISLNKSVTDEELKNETSAIQSLIKQVRHALNDVIADLKDTKKPVTAFAIKQAFIEGNKALLS